MLVVYLLDLIRLDLFVWILIGIDLSQTKKKIEIMRLNNQTIKQRISVENNNHSENSLNLLNAYDNSFQEINNQKDKTLIISKRKIMIIYYFSQSFQ